MYENNLTLVFALLGTILNLLFNVPQLIKTYRTKNVDGLSKKTIILRILCSCSWFIYALVLKQYLFMATCTVNVLSEFCLFVFKKLYKVQKSPDIKKIEILS